MLFDFFKKNNKDAEELPSNVLASITYIVLDNGDSPMVDVEMQDYDEKSIKALCKILDVLSSNKSIIETVDIIKEAMMNDGHGDNIIKIFTHISKHTKDKMLQTLTDLDNEDPCIKPSDVFMTK